MVEILRAVNQTWQSGWKDIPKGNGCVNRFRFRVKSVTGTSQGSTMGLTTGVVAMGVGSLSLVGIAWMVLPSKVAASVGLGAGKVGGGGVAA